MSTNCFVTKLKGTVSNESLPYFGLAKAYIDTTGLSSNTTVPFFGDKTGTKVLDGGTFADGSTVIENNAACVVAPDKVLTILYPKYNCSPLPELRNTQGGVNYGVITFDMDEAEYLNASFVGTSLRLSTTVGGHKMEGNLNYLLQKAPDNLENIMTDAIVDYDGIELDITTLGSFSSLSILTLRGLVNVQGTIESLANLGSALTQLNISNTGITGDRSEFFRNYCQNNKAAVKARTDTLLINISQTRCTDTALDTLGYLKYQFTGTSTVNILVNATSVKIAEYDIDTNSYTLVNS